MLGITVYEADLLRYVAMGEICFSVGYVLRGMPEQTTYLRLLGVSYILYAASAFELILTKLGSEPHWPLFIVLAGGTVAVVTQLYFNHRRRS